MHPLSPARCLPVQREKQNLCAAGLSWVCATHLHPKVLQRASPPLSKPGRVGVCREGVRAFALSRGGRGSSGAGAGEVCLAACRGHSWKQVPALGARRPPARVSFPDGFPVFSCGARCGAARGGCAGRGAGLRRCGGPAGGRSCGPRCPSPRGGVGAAAARQWGAQIAACRKLRHPVLPRRAGRWRDLLLSPCRPGMAGTEAGS